MDKGITSTLTDSIRAAMDHMIKQEGYLEKENQLVAVDNLNVEWQSASSLIEERMILRGLLANKDNNIPLEVKQLFLSCIWTIEAYFPISHIIHTQGEKDAVLLSMMPSSRDLLQRMVFYYSMLKLKDGKSLTDPAQTEVNDPNPPSFQMPLGVWDPLSEYVNQIGK